MAEINVEELVSPQQAAVILGIHFTNVYQWIKRGKIKSVVIAGKSFLKKTDVEALKKASKEENKET